MVQSDTGIAQLEGGEAFVLEEKPPLDSPMQFLYTGEH